MPVDIYIFNPTCELAVANGSPYWHPNLLLQQMESELANLPQFLSRSGDIILSKNQPSARLLETLASAGFAIPEFCAPDTLFNQAGQPEKHPEWLRPWGWSPEIHQRLKAIKPFCSREFRESPVADWSSGHKSLFSRQTALTVLLSILDDHRYPFFMGRGMLPLLCNSLEEVEKLAEKGDPLMLKQPWSGAGRGLQPLTRFPVHRSVKQRIRGMLRDQGRLFVEPLLDKVYDLGFLYEAGPAGIKFVGYSHFLTDGKGQYKGNYLNCLSDGITPEIKELVAKVSDILPSVHTETLQKMKVTEKYAGPIGIDTLIFRDADGHLRINPCLEINWRYTMGFIAHELQRHLAHASKGIFGMYYDKTRPFAEALKEQAKSAPLILSNDKIVSGILPLTEPYSSHHFGAYLQVKS